MSPEQLTNDEWDAIVRAPFCVYSLVASADRPPDAAQFRVLAEEITAARTTFPATSLGHALVEAIVADQEGVWAAYQASGLPPRDGIKRSMQALRRVSEPEAIAVRDWLLTLATAIARSEHMMGEPPISDPEARAIEDLAGWLERPIP
jgi:hypothetical protein